MDKINNSKQRVKVILHKNKILISII